MLRQMWITDPARGALSMIKPRAGVAYQGHEIVPAPRAVEEDWAGRDGANDTTAYLTSGSVTLNLALLPPNRALLDELGAYLIPSARPYLVIDDDEWASPRQVMLRYDTLAHPVELSKGGVRYVQYQWKAPRGVLEDTATQVWLIPADIPTTQGLAFVAATGAASHATTGFVMPGTSAAADTEVNVAGNARPLWRARLYGPSSGPALSRDDIGQQFAMLNGYGVAAGDYLEISSADLSANLLGQADASALSQVDWSSTSWPLILDAGVNLIRYYAASNAAPGTVCELTVWPVWMP